jgi:hypothetical protein
MHLAAMAAEYRSKYSGKPLICNFETAGWAWVCAGGSLPHLPPNTDPDLLASIPRMQPWPDASKEGRRILREPGRQMLIWLDGKSELDLSQETGAFRVQMVHPRTGKITPGELLTAGKTVTLPQTTIVWLMKE